MSIYSESEQNSLTAFSSNEDHVPLNSLSEEQIKDKLHKIM